jgi:hypothetical protein
MGVIGLGGATLALLSANPATFQVAIIFIVLAGLPALVSGLLTGWRAERRVLAGLRDEPAKLLLRQGAITGLVVTVVAGMMFCTCLFLLALFVPEVGDAVQF